MFFMDANAWYKRRFSAFYTFLYAVLVYQLNFPIIEDSVLVQVD